MIIPFALLAASHVKQINIGFFSRYPQDMLTSARREHEDLRLGKYRADTLYVVSEQIAGALVQRKGEHGLLTRLDGFVVFAPGYLASNVAQGKSMLKSGDDFGIPLDPGTVISFASAAPRAYTGSGWAIPEEWGTWSDGEEAVLNFTNRRNLRDDLTLKLKFNVFIAGDHLPAGPGRRAGADTAVH